MKSVVLGPFRHGFTRIRTVLQLLSRKAKHPGSDGHVVLCNDEYVFKDELWDQCEYGMVHYKTFHYRVFKLIGYH